jgi:hypothetical protein
MTRRFGALLGAVLITQLACQSGTQPSADEARPTTAETLFALSGSPQDYEVGIRALEAADLAYDVAEAKRSNDRRLIGMMGYGLIVPGVDPAFAQTPPPGYVVVAINGTSDNIRSDAQARFQSLLVQYAAAYNKALLGS